MEEKLFIISEEKLTKLIELLDEAPHKWAEYPILILRNLDILEIDDTPKMEIPAMGPTNNKEELLEG